MDLRYNDIYLKGRAKGKNNVKSATINWKSIMQWTLERRA